MAATRHFLFKAILIFLSFVLVACGGSSGSDSKKDSSTPSQDNQIPIELSASKNQTNLYEMVELSVNISDAAHYEWLIKRPDMSEVELSAQNSSTNSFSPDAPGIYVINVIVTDAMGRVGKGSVEVSASAATVNAGEDFNHEGYSLVEVTAQSNHSSPDYQWELVEAPEGVAISGVNLINSGKETVGFIPNVAGDYTLKVSVDRGYAFDTVTISVIAVQIVEPELAVSDNLEQIGFAQVTLSATSNLDDFQWSLVSPSGSTASLLAVDTANTSFIPDVVGDYVLTVSVDGGELSRNVTVTVSKPTLDVTPNFTQIGFVPITLNATSNLEDFQWSLAAPEGSAATLMVTDGTNTSFTPDVVGNYSFTVSVDEGRTSVVGEITIVAPTLEANPSFTQIGFAPITLNATSSLEDFQWSLAAPEGSAATLTVTDGANTSFTPDVVGDYSFTVSVDEGRTSVVRGITIVAPTVEVSSDFTQVGFAAVALSATSNLDDFQWTLVAPEGSGSVLTVTDGANTSFTPDVAGIYSLTVSVNGMLESATTVVTVVAPMLEVSPNFTQVGFAPIALSATSNLDDFQWSLIAPENSASTLSATDTASVSLTPDVAGDYLISVSVDNGKLVRSTTMKVEAPSLEVGEDFTQIGLAPITLSAISNLNDFHWSLAAPVGSSAFLLTSDTASTGFVPDMAGEYILTVSADGGKLDRTVMISVIAASLEVIEEFNQVGFAPIDISAASNLDDFQWVLETPSTSASVLSGADSESVSFTPDTEGIYLLSVSVDDGRTNASVMINVEKATLEVIASTKLLLTEGSVELTALTNMSEPDFQWVFESWPGAEAPVLAGSGGAIASFEAAEPGVYLLSVGVDGGNTQAQVQVELVQAWIDAGPDLAVKGNDPVELTASTNLSAEYTEYAEYTWSFMAVPADSQLDDSAIQNADLAEAFFVPDAAGTYELQVSLNGAVNDSVLITADEVWQELEAINLGSSDNYQGRRYQYDLTTDKDGLPIVVYPFGSTLGMRKHLEGSWQLHRPAIAIGRQNGYGGTYNRIVKDSEGHLHVHFTSSNAQNTSDIFHLLRDHKEEVLPGQVAAFWQPLSVHSVSDSALLGPPLGSYRLTNPDSTVYFNGQNKIRRVGLNLAYHLTLPRENNFPRFVGQTLTGGEVFKRTVYSVASSEAGTYVASQLDNEGWVVKQLLESGSVEDGDLAFTLAPTASLGSLSTIADLNMYEMNLSLSDSGELYLLVNYRDGATSRADVLVFRDDEWLPLADPVSPAQSHSRMKVVGEVPYLATLTPGEPGTYDLHLMRYAGEEWVAVGTPIRGLPQSKPSYGFDVATNGNTYIYWYDNVDGGNFLRTARLDTLEAKFERLQPIGLADDLRHVRGLELFFDRPLDLSQIDMSAIEIVDDLGVVSVDYASGNGEPLVLMLDRNLVGKVKVSIGEGLQGEDGLPVHTASWSFTVDDSLAWEFLPEFSLADHGLQNFSFPHNDRSLQVGPDGTVYYYLARPDSNTITRNGWLFELNNDEWVPMGPADGNWFGGDLKFDPRGTMYTGAYNPDYTGLPGYNNTFITTLDNVGTLDKLCNLHSSNVAGGSPKLRFDSFNTFYVSADEGYVYIFRDGRDTNQIKPGVYRCALDGGAEERVGGEYFSDGTTLRNGAFANAPDGTLHVAYQALDPNRVEVQRLVGGTWELIGDLPMDHNSMSGMGKNYLGFNESGQPFVVLRKSSSGISYLSIMVYDGENWEEKLERQTLQASRSVFHIAVDGSVYLLAADTVDKRNWMSKWMNDAGIPAANQQSLARYLFSIERYASGVLEQIGPSFRKTHFTSQAWHKLDLDINGLPVLLMPEGVMRLNSLSPKVDRVFPGQGMEVDPATEITLIFDREIDASTLSPQSFVVEDEGALALEVLDVLYDPLTRTATLLLDRDMEGQVQVSVVSGHIGTPEEILLDQGFSWSFRAVPFD